MGTKRDTSLIIAVVVVCAVVAVGLFAYVRNAPKDEIPPKTVTVDRQQGGQGVTLLTPYYKNDELAFKSEPAKVPPNVDPHVFVINSYLRSVKAVPEKALLVTCTVKDGVALLDFNKDFDTTYGTFDESTIINGIAAVMGQFQNVSYVRFLSEGKPIETLGNADLTEPVEVTRLASGQTNTGTPAKS
ncbi:MAG TPA: GerMN domain-containing protein [Fimbriimonadaceae bacterium]|nr:GerMN domain-containing protein [Fimbriimonadaceae bacterium]